MILYDPSEGKFPYKSSILDCDTAVPSWTWRDFIDTYIADYGHIPDEEKFREHIIEIMQMLTNNLMDALPLVIGNILKEVKNETNE